MSYSSALRQVAQYPDKDAATQALKTLRIYIKNIVENPFEPKFQVIHTENKAFVSRVAAVEGTYDVLIGLGFAPADEKLIMKSPNLGDLKDAIAEIDELISSGGSWPPPV